MKAPEDIRAEALGWLKQVQTVHLATWDGERPRVRPVSLVHHQGRFWVCTGSRDAKAAQVITHPVFEFSLLLQGEKGNGTLRVSGGVRVVRDLEEKSRISRAVPFFGDYWKSPEEESFFLMELVPDSMEYMRPGDMTAAWFEP